jgi:hypothetical protein
VVEEVCFAINADPLQIRREGDNANIIFLEEWSGVLKGSCRIGFMQIYRRYL